MPPKHSKLATGLVYKSNGATSKSTGNHGKKVIKKPVKKKSTNGAQKKGKIKKKILPIRERLPGIVENFIVVWLDSNINLSDTDYQNSMKQLQRIVNSVKAFTDMNECKKFLNQIKDEKIFLIVSGYLGEQIVPDIERLSPLHSIYVFCCDKSKHLLWASKYRKIKDVFTDIDLLCQVLQNDIKQCDNNLIPISILSKNDNPTGDLNELDSSFMYSKLLQEILMEIEHDNQAKSNLIEFCRIEYNDNQKELKIINEFNKNYTPSSAIYWYTRECFTYTMLNKALRKQDIEIILKMGFFLRDLHQQIEQLYFQERHQDLIIVYRGQGMTNEEFEELRKCPGGLLAFNNFLSTSIDRNIALEFAHRAEKDSNVTPILFQMEINPRISSTPFASIGNYSYYLAKEKEILFSMHTVFRIGEMKQMKNGIWKVNLKLTDDNDEQLQKLTEHMRQETNGSTGWHRLGALMIAMGQFDKAEEFYQSAYEMTSDDDWKELAHLHYQLGYIQEEKDDPENALKHYNDTLDLQLENVPDDDPILTMTYTGIGSALHTQCDLDGALEHFQYALEIARKNPNQNLLEIAKIHSYIGGVFNDQHEYTEALDSYQEALSIRRKNLPPVHPLLATTYNNMGLVYESMEDYSQAFSYFEKTLKIEKKSLPPDHPSLVVTYHNLSKVLKCLCRYHEAIEYKKHAVDIVRMVYEPDHPQRQREENDLKELQELL